MLSSLNSQYNLFVVKVLATSPEKYNTLLVDREMSSSSDYLYVCDHDSLQRVLNDTRFNACNVQLSNGNIWTSALHKSVSVPQMNGLMPLARYKNLWYVLGTLIEANAKLIVGDDIFKFEDLSFGMETDHITVSNSKRTYVLWSVPVAGEMYLDASMKVICDTDTFSRHLSDVRGISNISQNGFETTFSLNLYHLICTWDTFYGRLRFHKEELAYIAAKYQLLRAYVHGVELGHWWMLQVNDIDKPLHSHWKPNLPKVTADLYFRFIADFPNARKTSEYLADKTIVTYNQIKPFLDDEYLVTDKLFNLLKLPVWNCYTREFIRGVLSQLSDGAIRDFEYEAVMKKQKDLALLAMQIFMYKKVITTCDIQMPDTLDLPDGVLRVIRR